MTRTEIRQSASDFVNHQSVRVVRNPGLESVKQSRGKRHDSSCSHQRREVRMSETYGSEAELKNQQNLFCV